MFFDFHLNPYIYPNSEGVKRYPNARKLEDLLGPCDDPNFIDFLR
jgi:hypothetical protein